MPLGKLPFKGLWVALLVTGCALPTGGLLVTECVLPRDQLGTLSGKWPLTPVPIAFRAGQFSANEMNAIMNAADIWNSFYARSLNLAPIDYGTRTAPRESTVARPSSPCSGGGLLAAGAFSAPVVIYKHSRWPHSNPDAIALTTYCVSAGTPLPQMYSAIMDLNYENFFVSGKKIPDLTSIFVHEFGHLLGLDHSCDTKSKNGFPSCSDGALPDDYLKAVMYPIVPFDSSGNGVPKRELQANDQGRANCLYMKFDTNLVN